MEKIIFACCTSAVRAETLIFVDSIRKFGGKLKDQPIWLFVPVEAKQYEGEVQKELEKLDVKIIPFEQEIPDEKFPFVVDVNCAAHAEKLAKGKTEFLVWLAVNQFFIQEPSDFILPADKKIGYRPVHHKLIGSRYKEPVDSFWKLIYEKCDTPQEKLFPMKTHIDGEILRPYINSGFLVIRPEEEFFAKWWSYFKELYNDPVFKQFYTKDDLYVIFIHQAVLSALFVSEFTKDDFHELPFDYNFPIHLYHECLEDLKPGTINDLTVARFYLNKLQAKDGLSDIPIEGKLLDWLSMRLEKIEEWM